MACLPCETNRKTRFLACRASADTTKTKNNRNQITMGSQVDKSRHGYYGTVREGFSYEEILDPDGFVMVKVFPAPKSIVVEVSDLTGEDAASFKPCSDQVTAGEPRSIPQRTEQTRPEAIVDSGYAENQPDADAQCAGEDIQKCDSVLSKENDLPYNLVS